MSNTNSNTGSIMAADLARVIEDAALFASRDTKFPTLNAIRFESTSTQLVAVASDRFTIGASMASYVDDGAGPEFKVSLRLAQAQILARVTKSCKEAFSSVAVKLADEKLTFDFTSGESLTLPTMTGDFPDWRAWVKPSDGNEESTVKVVGYNPAYLARFSRVHGASRIAMKFTSPVRPALISVGTQFVGAIMPVRLGADDPEWQSPDWISQPEPKKKTPTPAPKKGVAARRKTPAKTTAAANAKKAS